jgi:hypothetical protein
MPDAVRWLIAIAIVVTLIGLIAYARGDEHHRGDEVGAIRGGVAYTDAAFREAQAGLR